MDDLRYHPGDFGMHFGIYSLPIAIVLTLLADIADWNGLINWIVALMILCQLIQVGSLGRIEGRYLSDNTFQEYGGGIYDRQSNGTFKKR